MAQIPYIFNQLCGFIPRDIFDRLVKKYGGNVSVKHYTCWNHLMVMIWAQLTSRRSLRDIENSLRAHSDKTYRMGMGKSISRNTIAHANARKDVAIFRELSRVMMERAARINISDRTLIDIAEACGVAGFFAIDSSTVSLDLRKYPWSVPQEGSGGVKIHTMFDIMRKVPRSCLITGHEERDQTFMEHYAYEPDCLYVLDKMYFKTRGLLAINESHAYFITRIKKNVVYEVDSEAPVSGVRVLKDETIRFTSRWASNGYPGTIRLISYYSLENNEVLKFLTNNFEIDAATIALLYKYRWEIELFFKWIKQHLRIVAFYGTSANAVMIQIYVGLITFCALALLSDSQKFKGSLYDLTNILSVALTEKCHISDLLNRIEIKDDDQQKALMQYRLDF